jgi:hypothetical protein
MGETYVRIREVTAKQTGEKVVLAHIRGMMRENLTKGDVEGILSGYPPWYREDVLLPNGVRLRSPIRSYSDVMRSGWVVALGMSKQEPLEAAPCPESLSKKPIHRLRDILADKILPAIPNEPNITTVLTAVRTMINDLSDSGIFIYLRDSHGRTTEWKEEIPKLSKADAEFVLNIFNSPPNIPLSLNEVTKLEPILLPLLHAAFTGAHTVVKALKNVMGIGDHSVHETNWHELLRDSKREVYLEDCMHLESKWTI